jgi:hypothetical protein
MFYLFFFGPVFLVAVGHLVVLSHAMYYTGALRIVRQHFLIRLLYLLLIAKGKLREHKQEGRDVSVTPAPFRRS